MAHNPLLIKLANILAALSFAVLIVLLSLQVVNFMKIKSVEEDVKSIKNYFTSLNIITKYYGNEAR